MALAGKSRKRFWNGVQIVLIMAAAFVMLIPIVWIGVHPDPVLRRLDSAVIDLLQTMESRSEAVALAPSRDWGEFLPDVIETAKLQWMTKQCKSLG